MMEQVVQSTDIRKLKKEMINNLYFAHSVTNENLIAEMRIAPEFELCYEIDILNDNNIIIADYINYQLNQHTEMPYHLIFGIMRGVSKRSYPTHELSLIEIIFTKDEVQTEVPCEELADFKSIQKFSDYVMAFFDKE